MSALSYATIVSGPRESSEVPNKSYQMDRALGIKPAFDNVFLSVIALLIHRELFVTSHCVIITGKYACEIASHIANKFGLVAAPAEKNEEAAVIHYTENLNIPYNGFIQVRLGVMQEPNMEYFYRFFDQVCKEALNEVLRGMTSQHFLMVAESIQIPPEDHAVCDMQAY